MRSLLVAVVTALLLPVAAAAHLVIEPGLLPSGQDVDLQIEVPELRPGAAPTSLTVSGAGVSQLRSSAVGSVGRETRWEVRVHVAAAPGPTELLLQAGFPDGSTVEVRRVVTVVPASSEGDGLPVGAAAFAALALVGLVAAAVILRRPRRTA